MKNIRKHSAFLILFIGLTVQVISQNKTNSIDAAINSLVKDLALINASISFVVKDLDSSVIISEYNPNLSLPSASTMKVVSSAAALDILGSFNKFETKIMYDGFIDSNNVLHGNIYIKGGGDPTLGSKYFKEKHGLFLSRWVDAIEKLGIDSIAGSIIGDASCFSDEYVAPTWSWGDIGNYYGAGVSGLSIYDNTVKFEFSSGPLARDSTFINCVYPYTPDLIIDNRVKASNTKKDLAYIYGGPNNPIRTIKGTIPKGQTEYVVKGAIHEPAYVTAFELESALWEYGIGVGGNATTIRRMRSSGNYFESERKAIFTTKSPTVGQIVYWTNLISNNLYAEHLLKHIGLKKYDDGSVFSSTLAVTKYWSSKGIDMTGFYMNDGSGLSRSNAITASQLVGVLEYMKSKSKYSKSFLSSLPVAGKTGTLRSVGKKTKIAGNLKAKSGTMTRIKSYAGYVKSASGRNLAFAIVVNNHNCTSFQIKKKLEIVMVALGNYND